MMSRTMTEYLETSLTEEQVTSLADQLSIKKMKSNPAVNHADRHAKCGSTFALLSSPRAESARAVTGRQCPHSWRGEDFLTGQPDFFYGNSCNSGTESRKIVPKVGK